jgi:hypothetical protein
MRRAVTSLLAAIALAAPLGLAIPATALAKDCEGYGCAHANYERTRDLPAYGSRYDGYWDRRGEGRRDRGQHHRARRDRDHQSGVHYYPGYGYYADGSDHRDGRRDRRRDGRGEGCFDQRHDDRRHCD